MPQRKNLPVIFIGILLFINALHARSIGITASNFGDPALGVNVTISNISTDLDVVFSVKKEDVHAYTYDYTSLAQFDAKTVHAGVRLNPYYSLTTKIGDVQFGPLFGFDRYWFTSKSKLPDFTSTITAYDSTLVFNQYRAGWYAGAKIAVSKRLSVVLGTTAGYLYGENVDTNYMIKNKMYKFDILDNKVGLQVAF